jgi:hypothetical protein
MLDDVLDRPLGDLTLLEEPGGLFVLGGWPAELKIGSDHAILWSRAGVDDLVDIRCVNGRGIYRLVEWDWSARVWAGKLVYSELEGLHGGNWPAT